MIRKTIQYFFPLCSRKSFKVVGIALFISGILLHHPDIAFAQTDVESEQIDREYIFELNEKISDLIDENHLDSARVLIDQALQHSRALDDIESESYSMLNKSMFFSETGRPDSILYYVDDDFEKYEGTEKEVRLGNLLATANERVGNYNRSLELYLEMLEKAEAQNDSRMIMGITQNLGNAYSSLGNMTAAIDSYLRSLEMAEETGDTLVTAIVLDNLASVNADEGNYELAEEYLNRALSLNEAINNRRNKVVNHMSFGTLYRNWERFDDALHHFNAVLDLSEEMQITITNIQALYNLGLTYTDLQDYDLAMEMFSESLEKSRENNIHIGSLYNQAGMANVYVELEDFENAIALYEDALEVAEMAGGTDLIKEIIKNLQSTHESAGDTSSAYDYLKRYSEMRDSLSTVEREEALARQEIELGLRLERENRELLEQSLQDQKTITRISYASILIILLAMGALTYFYRKQKRANQLLQERTEELTKVNDVKDQLLSVLSHDLRTPLSSLKGVVFLIREGVFEEKDINTALNEIDYQLQQGINTLSNYLQWAQNQRDGITANIEELSLKPFVDDAINEIEKSALTKGVVIDNRLQNSTLVLADEQLLRVVLRNLLSNAIKYVSEGDKIIIDLTEHKNTIELIIEDTGMGIPEDEKENLFKPFSKIKQGTKGEKGTGLGLSITKDFCEKMNGQIRFESVQGEKTTFFITLQKPSN